MQCGCKVFASPGSWAVSTGGPGHRIAEPAPGARAQGKRYASTIDRLVLGTAYTYDRSHLQEELGRARASRAGSTH